MSLPRPNSQANLLKGVSDLIDALEKKNLSALRRFNFGTATLTWNGLGTVSQNLVIAHGLAATPITVLLTPGIRSGVTVTPACSVSARDGTNFTAIAHTVDAQVPVNGSTVTVDWLALA